MKKKPTYQPDPKNARHHPKRNLQMIRRSLREVGAGRSILVDGHGIVRAGNATYAEAQALGMKIKPVKAKPNELVAVVRPDLVGNRAIRAALLDNRAADASYFDAQIIQDLAKRDATLVAGLFDQREWQRLMSKAAHAVGRETSTHALLKALTLAPSWNTKRQVMFLSLRKWRVRTKTADVAAYTAAKHRCDPALLTVCTAEITAAIQLTLGNLSGWYVTCPPPGASTGKHKHFATLLAQSVAQKLGADFYDAFVPRPRETPSHPRTYAERGELSLLLAFRANPPECPGILLVDDLASTGTTIEQAAPLLRKYGQVLPVVWLCGDLTAEESK